MSDTEFLAKLQQVIRQRLADAPEGSYTAKLASQGILIETNSPADFARFIKEDHARWGKVIKEAGIKGE